MKRFIIKTILFSLVPLICYISIFEVLKLKIGNDISKSEAIILGDSHTVHLSLPNVFNYSVTGSPYIIHYNFLENFASRVKDKKVILAFGYHNISPLYENRLNKNAYKAGWLPMVNREINTLNLIPKSYGYKWQKINILENNFSKSKLTNLFDLTQMESLQNTTKRFKDTAVITSTIEKHFTSPKYKSPDVIQKKYFSKIIELLEKQGCQIYLLNTPITEAYFEKIPLDTKSEYRSLIKKYDKTQLLDMNIVLKDKIDSSYFRDADHVNKKGDILIEKYLTDHILN